jgi:RimJ/RimL family protein N-acetyltransferase
MPTIHTERLILRPPTMADFDRWAELMADPEASRYIGGAVSKSMAWRALMAMAGAWTLTGVGMFSVIDRHSGRWLGRIGPWQPHDWPGTEVGWSLHPDAHGKGYATEAARAAIDYAFDTLGWTEVIHCIDPDNVPSQKVAERLGSRLRGPGRMPPPHENAPCEIWGQTREAWYQRHPRLQT